MSKGLFMAAGALATACATILWVGCSSSSGGATPAADAGQETGALQMDATADSPAETGSDAMSPADAAAPADASNDAPVVLDSGPLICGGQACSGSAVCCATPNPDGGLPTFACMDSCPDGGSVIQCDSPQQCPGNMKVCCGTIDVAGSGTACTYGSVSSSCGTSCADSFTLSCPATETVRFCAQAADCAADTANPTCCSVKYQGQTETFCVSAQLASAIQFTGGTCL